MKLLDRQLTFTVALVSDGGFETRMGNSNIRFVSMCLAGFLALFFFCLLIIAGYHVKLYQENGYRAAVSSMETHLRTIDRLDDNIVGLSGQIASLQTLDRAFRQYSSMQVPDEDMYRAGIGGHMIVDDEKLAALNQHLAATLHDLMLEVKSLEGRITLEQNSYTEIRATNYARNDLTNNTPNILPTQSLNITSTYGTRRNPATGQREFHDAVDITGKTGDTIYATAYGVILHAGYDPIKGNYVVIQHKYGYQTLYAHLHSILVEPGQPIKKYDVIGTMGQTGRTTGVNLHYSVSLNNRRVNPLNYF